MKKNKTKITPDEPQLERRKIIIGLGSLAVGSMIIPKVLVGNETLSIENKTKNIKRNPILPPGAVSLDYLNRHCTSCHLCVSRCPEKILQPAKLEYGLKGIMQPTIKYNNGFCEYDCIECQKVCPTRAIKPIEDSEEHNRRDQNELNAIKNKQDLQIGIAKYDKKLCQINDLGVNCGKCMEVCSKGAINMVEGGKNGALIPLVDDKKCIGCGACEYYCPTLNDKKAIWIDGIEVHKRL
jgi:ferredoxin